MGKRGRHEATKGFGEKYLASWWSVAWQPGCVDPA